MKNTILFFAFGTFLLLPGISRAALGDNCAVDITAKVPPAADWASVNIAEAPDGTAWQRAAVTSPQSELLLQEAEPVKLQGVAKAKAPVYLFFFSQQQNAGQGLKKPDIATCIDAGTADAQGIFRFEINAALLWDNLGQKMMVDAFYHTGSSYQSLKPKDTEAGVYFGTSVPPKEMAVNAIVNADDQLGSLPQPPGLPGTPGTPNQAGQQPAAGSSGTCSKLCATGQAILAHRLDPANAAQNILGSNFDRVGSMPVTMGRIPGIHTFYSGVEDANTSVSDADIQKIALKALGMEFIKRALLGVTNAHGVNPALASINEAALNEAVGTGGNYSDRTRQLARAIRSVLIGGATVNRVNQAIPLPDILPPSIPGGPGGGASATASPTAQPTVPATPSANPSSSPLLSTTPTPAPSSPTGNIPTQSRAQAIATLRSLLPELSTVELDTLFPSGVGDANWAQTFVQMATFWTGGGTINTCMMANDDVPYKNFKNFKGKNKQCDLERSNGVSPRLLLRSPAALILRPDFRDTKMVYTDRRFDAGNGWRLTEGKKQPLYYRYQFDSDFAAAPVAESCVSRDGLLSLIRAYETALALDSAEAATLALELTEGFPAATGLVKVTLADPAAVAERFRWLGDGQPLSLLQLFFTLEPDACDREQINLPVLSDHGARDGFEAGLL